MVKLLFLIKTDISFFGQYGIPDNPLVLVEPGTFNAYHYSGELAYGWGLYLMYYQKSLSQLSKYRHVVTLSIQGEIKNSQADLITKSFDPNTDLLIICSDGVHNHFDGLQFERFLDQMESSFDLKVELESKLSREASDNYSFSN